MTDDIVVIGGRDKMVKGLSPATGEELWTFTTRSKVESSPVIVGDRTIVASSRGKIYILSLKDGSVIWEFDSGSSTVASASVASNRFVIGTDDGILYCFGEK